MWPILLAIVETIGLITGILAVIDFFLTIAVAIQVWRPGYWTHPPDRDEIDKITKGLPLAIALQTLWVCTWWWSSGPIFLFQRYIRHNHRSTFFNPWGKE